MSSVRTVEVDPREGGGYTVYVGKGALDGVGDALRSLKPDARAVVISDETVGPTYGKLVKKRLETAGFTVCDFLVPPGEKSKSLDYAGELWQALARHGIGRADAVVAVGGGVVGDLAGFVASTYMRGIGFVQVPTTLLAMVDASVGGKTAVDLPQGKNLVGTFHQPLFVAADLRVLKSLDDEGWANGFAEIAKSSVVARRRSFYERLRDNAAGLAAHEDALLSEAVAATVEFKASVVAADLREAGLRECLNYGHTLGHAIEACAGFGAIGHGRAVAEGMRFAARLSVEVLGADMGFARRQDTLLDSLGLKQLAWTSTPERLLHAMKSDKKARGGTIRFILARDFSDWEVVPVDDELLMQHLEAWCVAKRRLIEKEGGALA